LGADPSGFDITQVLRMPVTRNHKYDGDPMVTCLWYEPDKIYDVRDVLKKIRGLAPPQEVQAAFEGTIERTKMSSKVRRLLLTPKDQIQVGKRSDVLWSIEMGLAESGFTADEIFKLVWPCAWNKWTERGTGQKRLEQEIRRAIGKARSKHADARTGSVASGSDERGRSGVLESLPRRVPERVAGKQGRESEDASGVDGSATAEGAVPDESRTKYYVEGFAGLVGKSLRRPRWMIDGIVAAEGKVIIAGEPKTSKSMIALAEGLAVASGEPFLGTYRVKDQGAVLFVDSETGEFTTQDRARRVGRLMGLIGEDDVVIPPQGGPVMISMGAPLDIPFYTISDQRLRLDDNSEGGDFQALLEVIELIQPKLVILDPLYLILGQVNENQSHEVRPILNRLSDLSHQMGCSVTLVHHYKKETEHNKRVRSGQRMSGSWSFHGWVDSALFCTRDKDSRPGWTRVKITTEQRHSGFDPSIELAWTMAEDDGVGMAWEVNIPQSRVESDERTKKLERLVLEAGGRIKLSELVRQSDMGRDAVNRYIEASVVLSAERKQGQFTWVTNHA